MNRNDINDRQLLKQIKRYFDGSLSDAEEELLRRRVAETGLRDPVVDEARALMGFRKPAQRAESRGKSVRIIVGIAASVAVALTVGINMLRSPLDSVDSTCIAYFNGQRITDETAVLDILAADLAQFDEASREMDESFAMVIDSVAPVIEDYQTELPFPEN